jgi:hypothetical protein
LLSLPAKIRLFSSPAGRYLLIGRLLVAWRGRAKRFGLNLRQPANILSGALMVISTSTVTPGNVHTLPHTTATPAAAAAPAAPAPGGTITIQIQDGSGRPGPNLQGVPEAMEHPPGSVYNTYARGNCTWYVATKRAVPNHWGNAKYWLSRARAAGYATGAIPVPGAIAQTTAGWAGHVAYVEAVQGDNVLVSEMNYRGLYRIDQRWAPASSFNYIY